MSSIVSSIVRSTVRSVVSGGATADPGPPEPEEFITNGGFADATDWSISAGWVISVGLATNTLAGGTRRLTQVFGPLTAPLITGNNYVLNFDVGNAVSVDLNVFTYIGAYDGSGMIGVGPRSTGAVSFPFVALNDSTTISFSLAGAEPTGMTIDNVSLVPA